MNHVNTNSPDCQPSVSDHFKKDNNTARQRLEVGSVKFLGTRKIYSNKSDISVRYKVGARTASHRRDRIVLVVATSESPRESLAYRFAPRYVAADRTSKVLFKYRFLPPSDPYRYYQFLYVTRQKKVIGWSTKFSIRDIEPVVRSTYAAVESAPTAADDFVADKVRADSTTLILETSLTDDYSDRTNPSGTNGRCGSSETRLTLLPLTFSRHAHLVSEKCRWMLDTGANIVFQFDTGSLNWISDPAKTSAPLNFLFRLPIKLNNEVDFLHLLTPSHHAQVVPVDVGRGTADIQRTAADDKDAPTGEPGGGGGVPTRAAASVASTFKSSVEKQLALKAWNVPQLSTKVSESSDIILRLPAGSGRLDLRRPHRVNRYTADLPCLDSSTNSTWTKSPADSDVAAKNSPVGSRLSSLRLSEQLCQLQQDLDELRVRLDSVDEKTSGQKRSVDHSSAAQQLSDVAHLLLRLFADLRAQLAEKEDAMSSMRREIALQALECSRLKGALAAERKRRAALAKCVSALREAEPRRERGAETGWLGRADRCAPQCTRDVGSLSDDARPFLRTPGFRKPSAKKHERFQREAKGERGELKHHSLCRSAGHNSRCLSIGGSGTSHQQSIPAVASSIAFGGAATSENDRFKTLAKNERRMVMTSTSAEPRRKATVGGNAPDAIYYYL